MIKTWGLFFIGLVLVFGSKWIWADAAEKSPRYDLALEQVVKQWPPKSPKIQGLKPGLAFEAWSTEGDEYYIGVHKQVEVNASIDRMDEVISDFKKYPALFPEFKTIREVSQDSGKIVTYWERSIPLPFVPNVWYQTIYTFHRSNPQFRVVKIRLKESNNVEETDNLLVLESKGPELTSFNTWSFFKADWGAAKILGLGRIWKESLEGTLLSDLALKFYAEHPEWPMDKIHELRKSYFNDELLEKAFQERQVFELSRVLPVKKASSSPPTQEDKKAVTNLVSSEEKVSSSVLPSARPSVTPSPKSSTSSVSRPSQSTESTESRKPGESTIQFERLNKE